MVEAEERGVHEEAEAEDRGGNERQRATEVVQAETDDGRSSGDETIQEIFGSSSERSESEGASNREEESGEERFRFRQ